MRTSSKNYCRVERVPKWERVMQAQNPEHHSKFHGGRRDPGLWEPPYTLHRTKQDNTYCGIYMTIIK